MATRRRQGRPVRRRSRASAFVGRVAAQLGILGCLGGIPYALYALAGSPIPDELPTWSGLAELLTATDDGSVFLGVVAMAGWIGWASFAVPLTVEVVCAALRVRAPRILGLAWQQRRAAALVAAALSIGAAPAVASASATPVEASPAATAAQRAGHPSAGTVAHALAAAPGAASAAQGTPVYKVAYGDWMYHIATRFLGDGDRYVEIAKLNPGLEKADPRFPDHIERGWKIRLPADAHDRGPRPHATGRLLTTPPPAERPAEREPRSPAPAQTGSPPGPTATTPAPTPSATPGSPSTAPGAPAPQPTPAHPPAADTDYAEPDLDDDSLDAALPITATLATAGLLAALLLIRVTQRRQRLRRYRRPGRRIPQPADPATERRVRSAAQPLDVDRLDHALRALAAGLHDRLPAELPDLVAAWLSGGEIHLMLAQPSPDAPPPFDADPTAMTWTLPADTALPDVANTLAPLPVLVTVASRPGGDHLLIDLERAGVLGIGGDRARAADLMRYLAAELATNQWSDDAEVVLAGFDPHDVDHLVAIGGHRIFAATSVDAAISRARRRAAANAAAMNDTGVPSAFAGRVGDIVADAWMPHVVLIADPSGAEQQLGALETELRLAGRCAVAAVAVTATPTQWRIAVAADGSLAIDWLSISNTTAARLPADQLANLARVMRATRNAGPAEAGGVDEPVPAASEPDPWAEGTDAHGHLLDTADTADAADALAPAAAGAGHGAGRPESAAGADIGLVTSEHQRERRPAMPAIDHDRGGPTAAASTQPIDATALATIAVATPARHTPPSPVRRREPTDPDLDDDLDAWYRPDPQRPRIAILGPVLVEGPGEAPDERTRFYSELVVYLAQRGRAGATGEQIDDAIWSERRVNARSRRVALSKVRRWLGEDHEGKHWLPLNVGPDRLYRLRPGILMDWQLFRRLRARSEARGRAGADQLRRALDLVRGEPLAGAELPYSSGYRNPYTWLPGSDIQPHNLASAIVDTAHQLVDLCLAAGDITGARWAVERAWLADPARLDDHPWLDAMRVAAADRRTAELRALLDDLVRTREIEVPEDLPPSTYASIVELVGDQLRVG